MRATALIGIVALMVLAPALGAEAATQSNWGSATTVGSSAQSPIVASDGPNIISAWAVGSGASRIFKYQVSQDAGTTWSTVSNLTDPGEGPVGLALTVSRNTVGVAYGSSVFGVVRARISTTAGTTWNGVANVSSSSGGEPSIAVAGSQATVGYIGGTAGYVSVTNDAGLTWSAPVVVAPPPASGFPVAMLQVVRTGASSTVTWRDFPVSDPVLKASTSSDGISWSSPTLLMDKVVRSSKAVVAGAARLVVTRWSDPVTSVSSIRVVRSLDGLTWSAPLVLNPGGRVDEPQVSVSGSRVTVAYGARALSGRNELRFITSGDGGDTWGTPSVVADSGSLNIALYSIFPLDDAVVAAYNVERSPTDFSLQVAMTFDGGANWGAGTEFASSGDGIEPSLAGYGNQLTLFYQDDLGSVMRQTLVVTPDPPVASASTSATAAASGVVTSGPALASTGVDTESVLSAGGVVVVLGLVLVAMARRKRSI